MWTVGLFFNLENNMCDLRNLLLPVIAKVPVTLLWDSPITAYIISSFWEWSGIGLSPWDKIEADFKSYKLLQFLWECYIVQKVGRCELKKKENVTRTHNQNLKSIVIKNCYFEDVYYFNETLLYGIF